MLSSSIAVVKEKRACLSMLSKNPVFLNYF
jgi:hypothetical protein